MHKVTNPDQLKTELELVLKYAQGSQPSRQVLASKLDKLAKDLVAGKDPGVIIWNRIMKSAAPALGQYIAAKTAIRM